MRGSSSDCGYQCQQRGWRLRAAGLALGGVRRCRRSACVTEDEGLEKDEMGTFQGYSFESLVYGLIDSSELLMNLIHI